MKISQSRYSRGLLRDCKIFAKVSLKLCLEVELPDPGGHPAQLAVAGEEPASEAEAAQRGVEVGEGGLGQRGHGVAVQREQGEAADPGEGVLGQHAEQVKPEVQHLNSRPCIGQFRCTGWPGCLVLKQGAVNQLFLRVFMMFLACLDHAWWAKFHLGILGPQK